MSNNDTQETTITVVDDNLIGRELFFTLPANLKLKDTDIGALTPNKRYIITGTDNCALAYINNDVGAIINPYLVDSCAYLHPQIRWQLADIEETK
jgi:hypothetical protein